MKYVLLVIIMVGSQLLLGKLDTNPYLKAIALVITLQIFFYFQDETKNIKKYLRASIVPLVFFLAIFAVESTFFTDQYPLWWDLTRLACYGLICFLILKIINKKKKPLD
ncbi:hypothetical protein [Paenibacillus sp. 481]|uniref:hypothetical protein n=1 Tax=Paenibacillus sp. 481 TaxID=2835869 RepID=UPI001E2E2380|nr:hypothetical protein [Paenibacillus sp. 481]UHA74983.1 hypothetical protein KIK04_08125 [Paenibacillus sp. 481]